MIEIFDCKQGTPEWREARRGIPTVSEFHSIFAKGQGKTRRKYLYQLVGEILTGDVLDGFTTLHTERGHLLEAEAISLHAFDVADITRPGFVRRKTPSGYVGCSPDALVGDDGMIEVKTKLPHLQLEVIAKNDIPPEHYAQVQGALWVTQRKWIDFISYWPGLPLFVQRVEPHPDYVKQLELEVNAFNNELAAAVEAMKDLPRTPKSKLLQIDGTNEFTNLDT